jgi:hypothetical protein
VLLKIFWNFISSSPMKRGGSLSFLTIFTFAVQEFVWFFVEPHRTWSLYLYQYYSL